jgi:magnesium transporter
MRKLIRRSSRKAGLPPGSLVHVGEKRAEPPNITVFDYDADHVDEREVASAEECIPFKDSPTVTWINVSGIHQPDMIGKLGACYGIHPLVLEDILNAEQRPKIEYFEDYVFVALKMLYLGRETRELVAEQISLIIGPNFVISFQETPEDVFQELRNRIRNGRGRIRAAGSDYLAHALLDAVVDGYFSVLERFAAHIEDIEEELVAEPTSRTLQVIYKMKRELIFLRRSVWPLREVISTLGRGDSPFINEATLPYLRDVYDHTIQVIDTTESLRDVVSGMHDTYLSSLSNRMNEIMKVLTIIATIFIPLTFIAGIYGMNFEYMPELRWHWSYFLVWGIMGLVGISMVAYFRRKRWL